MTNKNNLMENNKEYQKWLDDVKKLLHLNKNKNKKIDNNKDFFERWKKGMSPEIALHDMGKTIRRRHRTLAAVCKKFINDNEITCAETIHSCDGIGENSYAFIEKICDLLGYYKEKE